MFCSVVHHPPLDLQPSAVPAGTHSHHQTSQPRSAGSSTKASVMQSANRLAARCRSIRQDVKWCAANALIALGDRKWQRLTACDSSALLQLVRSQTGRGERWGGWGQQRKLLFQQTWSFSTSRTELRRRACQLAASR